MNPRTPRFVSVGRHTRESDVRSSRRDRSESLTEPTGPTALANLTSRWRSLFGEPREVFELLAVRTIHERSEDRACPPGEPVRDVVHAVDRLGVGDARAFARGRDVVSVLEVRLPRSSALPFEGRVGLD